MQYFPLSKPSLATYNPGLVIKLENVVDESGVPPAISPLSANSFTISVLSDYLSQKEKETLHSSIENRSALTVADLYTKIQVY